MAPTTSWGAYLSALHASSRKDANRASAYFEAATPALRGRTGPLRHALLSHVRAGRMRRAVDSARAIADLSPGETMAHLVLALEAAREERFADAQRQLSLILVDSVSWLFLPPMQAWAAFGRHGDVDLALQDLRKPEEGRLLRRFRRMHRARHRAHLLDLAGRPQPAAQDWSKVTGMLSSPSLRLTEAVANFHARSGAPAAALETIDRYLAAHPESTIGKALRARYRGGGTVAPLIGSPADGMAEVLLNVASLFGEGERAAEALPMARLAAWMRPRDAASAFLLGTVLSEDGRHRDAIAAFRQIGGDTAYGWEARKAAAGAMVDLERHEAAATLLERMAAERPERFDALWMLGNVHRSRSAFDAAVAAYDRAVQRVPQIARRHWNLLYGRGIALERAGQWARAEADFLRALELNPGQPYVLNYLAYSWVDRGEKLKRARVMLAEAVGKRPNDGYIVDSVGWVEYRLGNFEAAVRHLERATELRPHDPIINRHLGDAYWRAGRRQEARFQWRRALWLKPEEAERALIGKRIREGMPPFRPIPRQ